MEVLPRLTLGLGLLTLVVLARWFPFAALPPLCTFRQLVGLPCLTCGMTRAWVAMAHGHPGQGLGWNPLGVALFLATVGALLYGIARSLGAPALRVERTPREGRVVSVVIVLTIAVNWTFVVLAGRV